MSEIATLVCELQEADRAYATGNSIMSNTEYDQKKDRLRKLDPLHSYFTDVGDDDGDSKWKKHTHEYPLGSLDKVTKIEALKKWIPSYPVIVQEKLDGLSIALTYENGTLVRGVTRGKRGVGDDITRNVVKMKGVVSEINEKRKVVIRGEIMFFDEDYQVVLQKKMLKNRRNGAAGTAKKEDGTHCEHLTVVVYDVLNAQELGFTTEKDCLGFLNDMEFKIVNQVECENFEDVKQLLGFYEDTARAELPFDIDGMVIKPNDIDFNDDWELPKNKIAWKFASQEISTILKKVTSHTKGDRVQPMAILEPVDIGGVTVSKASLHNWKIVEAMELTEGAEVIVSRRNEVIPQVEQVIKPGIGEKVETPTRCPVCATELEWEKGVKGNLTDYLICPNEDCDAKALKAVKKWLDKHETKGVSTKTISTLYHAGIFNSLPEFLRLSDGDKDDEILILDGMGSSKLDTLKSQIEMTRGASDVVKFFAGLNFHNAGRRVFDHICETIFTFEDVVDFQTMLTFLQQPVEAGLCHVEGLAEPSAIALQEHVNNRLTLINDMSKLVNIGSVFKPDNSNSSVAGSSFCFTGALDIKRKEAEKMVKELGGVVKSSASKDLDYLVTDDPVDPDGGSSKMKKACKLGIKIISGSEFMLMVN